MTLAAESEPSLVPQVLLWSDSSTRFLEHPEKWAKRMLQDHVDFVCKTGGLGMGENTHHQTYEYFNMSESQYKHKMELAASTFLVNLARKQGMEHIL